MTLDFAPTRSAVGLDNRPVPADLEEVESYIATVQMAHSLTGFADLPQMMPAEGVLYQAHEAGGPVVLAVRNPAASGGGPRVGIVVGVLIVIFTFGLLGRLLPDPGNPALAEESAGSGAVAMPTRWWKSSAYSSMSFRYTRLPPERPCPRRSRA